MDLSTKDAKDAKILCDSVPRMASVLIIATSAHTIGVRPLFLTEPFLSVKPPKEKVL